MSENKRIGRNVGRIEMLAVQEQVKALLEAGYDRKKIHDRLLEDGGVTMSYPTFCYQLKQLLTKPALAVSPNPSQRPKPLGPPKANSSEPFSISRNPKEEELIGVKS